MSAVLPHEGGDVAHGEEPAIQEASEADSPVGDASCSQGPSSADNNPGISGHPGACYSSESEDDLVSDEPLEISVTQVLQAILKKMYRRNGEPKELVDLEIEARLLTGEVFEEEKILTDQEALRAYTKVLCSVELRERRDSATAVELLEECLAEWEIFPPPSILLG